MDQKVTDNRNNLTCTPKILHSSPKLVERLFCTDGGAKPEKSGNLRRTRQQSMENVRGIGAKRRSYLRCVHQDVAGTYESSSDRWNPTIVVEPVGKNSPSKKYLLFTLFDQSCPVNAVPSKSAKVLQVHIPLGAGTSHEQHSVAKVL